MLIAQKSLAGVTLIELMIAITILGILLVLGLPESFKWMQNTRIRTSAESISNGLQLARGEAVRRNTRVEFVLTADPNTTTANVITNNSGPNWVVRAYDSLGNLVFIQGAAENSPNVVINSDVPNVTFNAVISNGVVFNGLGRACDDLGACLGANGTNIKVTNPKGGACVAAGPMRCLKVEVQSGGQIKMCDPAAPAGDNRACLKPLLP